MTGNTDRDQINRLELASVLSKRCKVDGENKIASGLCFYRYRSTTAPNHGVYLPAICVVAQGAKEVDFGGKRLRYDPANFLLISLDVPVISQVVEASPEQPYLGLKLDLDPSLIASVMVESGIGRRTDTSVKSMDVSHLSNDLLDAFVRLVRLLNDDNDYRMVSPMVIREIVYRLLKTDQVSRLCQMSSYGGNSNRITKAIHVLRTRFNEPIKIEQLADELGMSLSSFHQHFKTATSMSPLQYQKALRLQEARKLLLSEDMDASTAANRVGYDDPSQFSREYKRLFGESPKRDVARLKELVS